MQKIKNTKRYLLFKVLIICIFTGFISGLPFYFIIQLIPAWLKISGIDIKTIGAFTLLGIPYTLKFLWAPLADSISPKFLGRRKSWLFVLQILLVIALASFSLLNPNKNIYIVELFTVILVFISATQDIVVDAYRREILGDNQLGLGNTIHVQAYRISSLIPGSLALIVAGNFSWDAAFIVTSLFMIPGIIFTLFIPEPKIEEDLINKNYFSILKIALGEFFQRKGVKHAVLVLVFIILYKLGDSMAISLITPFYLEMGYSLEQIGIVAKNAALWPSIIFGILGGVIMLKIGINKALWLFGIVQVVTILGFAWLSSFGHFSVASSKELWMLAGVIAAENAGVGLGTTAFVAFIARETNPLYTATQFALLASLTGVPRTIINASSGYLVNYLGYYNFFWLCFFLAFPGMILLIKVAPWNEK